MLKLTPNLLLWFIFLCLPVLTFPPAVHSAEPPQPANRQVRSDSGTSKSERLLPSQLDWRQRRGMAYPGNPARTLIVDLKEFPVSAYDDVKTTLTNPPILIGFSVVTGLSVFLSRSGFDRRIVRRVQRKGPRLSPFLNDLGDRAGRFEVPLAATGLLYAVGSIWDREEEYKNAKATFNAMMLTGVTTLALKGTVYRRRPCGGSYSWPSGHSSTAFCFAAAMYESYGPAVGVPLYFLAGLTGYQRIDSNRHYVSDVISGAFIGSILGHTIVRKHQSRIKHLEVHPMVDPVGNSAGIAVSRRW